MKNVLWLIIVFAILAGVPTAASAAKRCNSDGTCYGDIREYCIGSFQFCYRGFWSPQPISGRTCYPKVVSGRTIYFCLQ
jgi:hypothetical protein